MRFEFKYIVAERYLDELRNSVRPFVEVDPFADAEEKNEYTVRSIYFDTPNFDYYYEKIDGIKNRKKLRIRGYDDVEKNNTVFLEIKRKYDVPIKKYRAPVNFEDAQDIFKKSAINGHVLNQLPIIEGYANSKRFFFQMYSRNLRPTVLVVYDREAYYSKFDRTVRLTFDKRLRGEAYPELKNLFNERNLRSALHGRFILEVKFNNHFPSWLHPVISRFNLKRQSASKYVITMDACNVIGKPGRSTLYTRAKWYV
ncbi:MAG: polyphosphate polymerase domain-containing protein [Bacteroidales bacterium]|nr:polyphosphate polymerase domain-containing protein [Bacteroidales bacterium]